MGERLPKLLIVEDDPHIAEMLDAYFGVLGYEILIAGKGEDGIKLGREKLPDLILLDIRLPDIDGYEVAGRLKAEAATQNIPIFFLTERRERMDRLAGFEVGATDYITKPFDMQELRLRVRNALRRVEKRPAPAHPLTGLPEGATVDRRLEKLLKDKSEWALMALSLTGLKAYRKRYGVVASDDALRGVGVMVSTRVAANEKDHKADFTGHLGPEDFVVVTTEARLESLRKRLVDDVFAALPYFYPAKDREVEGKKGKTRRTRLELTVGQVRLSDGPFESVAALKEAVLKAREAV